MPENIVQSVQQLVQDVIAPDVRELKVRMASLEKQIGQLEKQIEIQFAILDQKTDAQFRAVDQRFSAMDQKFSAMDQKNDAQFKALMAAISESKAQAELTNMRVIAALSERVAVLESQRH